MLQRQSYHSLSLNFSSPAQVIIQAAVGATIIARERCVLLETVLLFNLTDLLVYSVAPLKKDVTHKIHGGGDISRKVRESARARGRVSTGSDMS